MGDDNTYSIVRPLTVRMVKNPKVSDNDYERKENMSTMWQ